MEGVNVWYHLNCLDCGHDWWSKNAFPKICPFCKADRSIPGVKKTVKEKGEKMERYDSPISIVEQFGSEIETQLKDGVYIITKKHGFHIDEDKLVEALTNDRKRYTEAYRKGRRDFLEEFSELIEKLKDDPEV